MDDGPARYDSAMWRRVSVACRRGAGAAAAVVAAALLLPVIPAPEAGAHVPFLEPARSSAAAAVAGDPFPGAVPVPDAAVSRAVYGTLTAGEPFDAYRVTVSRPAVTPLQLLVPAASRYARFRPAFAFIGPDVPPAGVPPAFVAGRLRTAYGTAAGDVGVRVVADPGAAARPTFYEPFSFSTYYRGGETSVRLRPGEEYYLVVYDPAGGAGEYVLGVAEAERFTPGDWLRAVAAVVRIKLGLYGQGAFRPLAATVLALVVAALAGLVVWRVRRRRRRRAALRGRATAAGP